MINQLREVLEQNKQEYLDKLSELIRIDTQHIGQGIDGGKEYDGQQYLKELAQELNATNIIVDPMQEKIIQSSIEEYHEGNPGHNYEKRENLYVEFISDRQSKTLMFNGHIDTMPPGPLELWDSDPWNAYERDGKLYGLGATDMKAGLIAPFLAIDLLKKADIDLKNNILITSVVDEEGGGNGSIQAAYNAPKADAVVVCEGTDYELILAHMGFIFFRVTIEGKSNHAGEKWKGTSAIDKAVKIMNGLKEVEYEWLYIYNHRLLPPPNINFGVLKGGSSGATVSGQCVIEMCIHYHPQTMSYNSVKDQIESSIHKICQGDEWLSNHAPKIEIFQAGGAFEMDENTPFVEAFKKSYREQFEKEVKVVGSPAGCDSRTWKNIAKIDTIQYGPGRLSECHSANEYVRIQEFYDAILTYALLMINY